MLWRRWSTESGDQSKIASGGSVSIRCSLFLDRNSVNLESRAQSRKEEPPTWESDFTESEREMQVFLQTWGKCVVKTSKTGIWWWGIGEWLQTWPLVSYRSKFKFCFCHLLARCSSYILSCNKPPQCLVAWINNHVFVQKFYSWMGLSWKAPLPVFAGVTCVTAARAGGSQWECLEWLGQVGLFLHVVFSHPGLSREKHVKTRFLPMVEGGTVPKREAPL